MQAPWRHLGVLLLGVACAVPKEPDAEIATWRYTLAWSAQHDVLHGELTLPAGDAITLAALPVAEPFLTTLLATDAQDYVVPAA